MDKTEHFTASANDVFATVRITARDSTEECYAEILDYTILFNLSGDRPELCKERNRLQLRKSGYSLKVDHNMLMLFTWPILEQFTPEKVKDLISYYRVHKKPMIELANGWYHIEILGGETLQDGDYEPTFEFVIQPATNEEVTINADMNFSFEITSSAY